MRVEVGDVDAAVEFGRMPAMPFSKKMFMDLHRACDKRLRVKLQYLSAYKGELTSRTVDPYRLLSHQNSWYLVAHCNLRHDLRLFALHRIHQHEVTEETFEPMDKDKLESWLKSPLFIEHQEQGQFMRLLAMKYDVVMLILRRSFDGRREETRARERVVMAS